MGSAPSKPQNGRPEEWLSPEALEYDRSMALYEQYFDSSEIGKTFDPSGEVTKDDLEQGFKAYIGKGIRATAIPSKLERSLMRCGTCTILMTRM